MVSDGNDLDAVTANGSRRETELDRVIVQRVKVTRAYEQLAALLREQILSGDLREGDRLPSETSLAAQASAARRSQSTDPAEPA